MALIARDGLIPARSVLPPGGGPRDDEALLGWASAFADRINARWLDLHYPGLPDRELIASWQVIYHLHKHLIGWAWPDGTGPNRAHRIRFVAIQFRLRRAELVDEARRYARELYDKATDDGSGTRDD